MFGFIDKIYGRSSSWRSTRNEHVKNNPTCAACGTDKDLDVHHVVPYHVDPSLELDPNNLITLCGKRCHYVFGHLCDWKSWNEEVVEDCRKYNLKRLNRPHEIKFSQMPQENTGYKNAILNFIFDYLFAPFISRD